MSVEEMQRQIAAAVKAAEARAEKAEEAVFGNAKLLARIVELESALAVDKGITTEQAKMLEDAKSALADVQKDIARLHQALEDLRRNRGRGL